MRFLGLIAVLVVAASIAAASAQTQNRGAHDGNPPGVKLTYTTWFVPTFPNMVGVVGGDIVGQIGGAVLERTVDPTGHFAHLTTVLIVIAPDPARSFTLHIEGVSNLQTGMAVLDGRVVDGWLRNAHAHVDFSAIHCTEAPNGNCYQGTISISRASD